MKGFRGLGLRTFRVQGSLGLSGCRVQGIGFRVQGLVFWFQGVGFQGVGF